MTKQEAIEAMKQGKKVTHPTFTDRENISMLGNFTIVTTEGYEVNVEEFWKYRTHANFDKGWNLFHS